MAPHFPRRLYSISGTLTSIATGGRSKRHLARLYRREFDVTQRLAAGTIVGAVRAYERLGKRYPDATGGDFLFLPDYTNRATAAQIFARQFNLLLNAGGLKSDPVIDPDRSLYSLHHIAICLRIILSHGKAKI